VGDEVYGDISDVGFGTFAEYVAVEEKALVHKPEKMSFEEAAAISHASMLAYQGLIDVGNIQNGQKILINGAGGGVGTFGLQIAKLYDAEVTGVDTGEKLQMMQSIGFDHIIDYKKEDFTKNGQQYDLVLDTKTNRAPLTYLRALRPGGKYVTVGGKLQLLFRMLLAGFLMKTISSKSLQILALKPNKDLEAIHQLFKAGKLKVVMDGPYPLEKGPEIVQYFGEGLHQGKVILSPLIKTT
jgi:NADPH:quinone reductase-like Zn-dependent oxidoreductase